jgi:hypothetical protein
MQKQLTLKHWRTPAILVLAALAVIASASQAFAQGQPNESDSYNPETFEGNKVLVSSFGLGEARDLNGNLLDAWVAHDSSQVVWMSYNHGVPFQVATTKTNAAVAVAPWGTSSFIVLQTGTDSKIYYTFVNGTNSSSGTWFPIPGQTTPTNMAVSAAQIGTGSQYVFVTYRGSGNDTRVFGTFINPQGEWSTPTNFAGGLSPTAPAVCLNNAADTLWATAIGTDNQVWITHQTLGSASWNNWAGTGQFTGQFPGNSSFPGPSCAALSNGNVVVDYAAPVASNNPVFVTHFATYNNDGELVHGWTKDITSFQTLNTVNLVSSGDTVWALLEDQGCERSIAIGCDVSSGGDDDGIMWWKVVTTE